MCTFAATNITAKYMRMIRKTAAAARRLAERRHRVKVSPWVKSTMSGLVGTTLGILLTFGTDSYIDYVKKEEMAEMTTKMVFRQLHVAANQISAEAEKMKKADSVYQYLDRLYPDSIAYAKPEMAEQFNKSLSEISLYAADNTVERIFSSSNDTWETLADADFVNFVGTAFTMINEANKIISDAYEERHLLFANAVTADEIYDIHSNSEFAMYLMRKHEVRDYMFRNTINAMVLANIAEMIRAQRAVYMQKMGLDESDLFEHPDTVGCSTRDSADWNATGGRP